MIGCRIPLPHICHVDSRSFIVPMGPGGINQDHSGENIFIILFVGLRVGLLPSTIVQRNGFNLVSDLAIGIVGVFIIGWLTLALRDLPPNKPTESISKDLAPG